MKEYDIEDTELPYPEKRQEYVKNDESLNRFSVWCMRVLAIIVSVWLLAIAYQGLFGKMTVTEKFPNGRTNQNLLPSNARYPGVDYQP